MIFIDSALLVVNKPPGLLTLPDCYDPTAPHLRSILEPLYGRLWIVHRLDRETSGIIVLARSAAAHRALNDQFASHSITKVYHALVVGEPSWDEKMLDLPLRANVGRRHRTQVDLRRGKPATTHLQVLERLGGAFTLLQAIPQTGRTHQIRAHLAWEGIPILGDSLYGEQGESPFLPRLGLHAYSLTFRHPLNGEECRFEASYPPDINATLHQLRVHCKKVKFHH